MRRRPRPPVSSGFTPEEIRGFLAMGSAPARADWYCADCGVRWFGPGLEQCPLCPGRNLVRSRVTITP